MIEVAAETGHFLTKLGEFIGHEIIFHKTGRADNPKGIEAAYSFAKNSA
jgi:hypothetical protein